MASRICVIDLPGLSRALLDFIPPQSTLGRFISSQPVAELTPSWPAVTCSVQATLTTGVAPSQHGIVANGIATFRSAEDQRLIDASNFADYRHQISFWEQSNQFLDVRRFWQDSSGASRYKTALLFFQNSMPGFAGALKPAADIVVTPKPEHGPDGKTTSLLWSNPHELAGHLQSGLGPFPLMNYWGPMAGIASSRWIVAAACEVWRHHTPQLQLVYVPHLDYDLQRFGPESPQAHQAVRDVSEALEPLLDAVSQDGARVVVLSEYAMTAVRRVIQPNRILREAGLLRTRATGDGHLVDYEQSDAFAMCDHQIAHVYLRRSSARDAVIDALRSQALSEVDERCRISHRRAGNLQFQSDQETWLDYRWWDSPDQAPSFARLVDIHRKPGYDPLELFFDPATKSIAQDATLVRGSHGASRGSDGIIIGATVQSGAAVRAVNVAGLIRALIER
ncbi:MAG: alkaline phosphatase family protein [Tepidisphaeraceae bacterium]